MSTTVLQFFKPAPSDEEIAALKAKADEARAAYQVEADRAAALRAELAKFQDQAKPRPDLDAALAAATELEIKARVLGSPGAKDAAKKLADAREAVEAAAARSREAEVVIPAVRDMLAEQEKKAEALRLASVKADGALGSALMAQLIAREYAPALNAAVAAIAKAREIEHAYGSRLYIGLKVRDPDFGLWFDERELAATAAGQGAA